MELHLLVEDQSMPGPPPVPKYWVFSNDTFEDPDPQNLCSVVFQKLESHGVFIQKKKDWHWEAQYCDGPHYITFDIYVFAKDGAYTMDVNRLSGDRWSWWRLMLRVKGKKVPPIVDRTFRPLTMTHTSAAAALKRGDVHMIGTAVVWIVGDDQMPESVLQFLDCKELNLVRAAMLRLTHWNRRPDDCTKIQKWRDMPDQSFLHREIKKHAETVLNKYSRL